MTEAELMQSLSEYLSTELDDQVTVKNYIIIADVIDNEGRTDLVTKSSNENYWSDLAMIEYMRDWTKHQMVNGWKRNADQ